MGPAERARLLQTFDDGWVSSAGPVVEAFERVFAEATGFAHATAMSSGTAALQVALTMLDLKPGDAVIDRVAIRSRRRSTPDPQSANPVRPLCSQVEPDWPLGNNEL